LRPLFSFLTVLPFSPLTLCPTLSATLGKRCETVWRKSFVFFCLSRSALPRAKPHLPRCALAGVGGVFIGASDDVRSVAR